VTVVSFTTEVLFLEYWIYWLGILNEKYSYAALRPLDEHHLTLELPGKNRATWSEDDEDFFHHLGFEGFLQEWTKRFYRRVAVESAAHRTGGTRSMTMVFLTLEMPYEKFPAFTGRLAGMYPYSALQSLGGHNYTLELPDISRETWSANDDSFFSDVLGKEGFLQAGSWHKRFYWLLEDEEQP
jgi:hypothetical protein